MNVRLLRACCLREGLNGLEELAPRVGLKLAALYSKTSGNRRFTLGEVERIRVALELTDTEVVDIFIRGEAEGADNDRTVSED